VTHAAGAAWWLVALLALAGGGLGGLLAARLAHGGYRREDERHRPLPAHRWWMVPGLALVWAGLAWRFGGAGSFGDARHFGVLAAYLCLGVLGVVLAAIDADVHRLPDPLVLPSYPAAIALLAVASWSTGSWGALLRAVLAGAVLWVAYLLLALVSPGGLGFGDVKLAGVLGLFLGWLGWGPVVAATFAAFLLGGLFALVLLLARRVSRSSHIAFGPAMLAGAWLALLVPVQVVTGTMTG
jgi:leader peptidase (prepilin peptidase)/N-methyltransferase